MHEDFPDLMKYGLFNCLSVINPKLKVKITTDINNIPEIGRKPKIKQIIFHNPAVVVVLDNGTKIVSKAHKEEFDKEKGLLMCLAKLHGITHLELQRMIKNGVDFNKKEN